MMENIYIEEKVKKGYSSINRLKEEGWCATFHFLFYIFFSLGKQNKAEGVWEKVKRREIEEKVTKDRKVHKRGSNSLISYVSCL